MAIDDILVYDAALTAKLDCPAVVVGNTDLGEEFGFVSIALPDTMNTTGEGTFTNLNNGSDSLSGTYYLGANTVGILLTDSIFTDECEITVNVLDNESPSLMNCDADAVYAVESRMDSIDNPLVVTDNVKKFTYSPNQVINFVPLIAFQGVTNAFSRIFDLDDDFLVSESQVRLTGSDFFVQQARSSTGEQACRVNIYTLDEGLAIDPANFVLIHTELSRMLDGSFFFQDFDFDVVVNSNQRIVVEIFSFGSPSASDYFYLGGQSDKNRKENSYLRADDDTYINMEDEGLPEHDWVINLNTEPIVNASDFVGDKFPVGISQGINTYTDAYGNSETCAFKATILAPPVATQAIDLALQAFTATWETVEGAETYTVQIATDSDFNNIFRTVPNVTGTTLAVNNLARESTYWYRVKAVNGSVMTIYGNQMRVVTGALPATNLTVGVDFDANGDKVAGLKWDVNSVLTGSNVFQIVERTIAGSGSWQEVSGQLDIATDTIADSSLDNISTYIYRIKTIVADPFDISDKSRWLVVYSNEALAVITGSIDDVLNRATFVNPNPSNGLFNLTISNFKGDLSIEVLDITGRLISKQDFSRSGTGFEEKIDLTTQQSGVYLLRISSQNGFVIRRLVKQ